MPVGTLSVNGESSPRLWRITLAVQLPPGVSQVLVRRLATVERRVSRLAVSGESGRVAALVLALEQLADVADPPERHIPPGKQRAGRRRSKGTQS
jgi:hypothetical protein